MTLPGKKTYIAAVAYVACVILENVFAVDVPGFVQDPEYMADVFNGVIAATIRAGIGKIQA